MKTMIFTMAGISPLGIHKHMESKRGATEMTGNKRGGWFSGLTRIGLGVAIGILAGASHVSGQVLISQIYGGGGNSGAPYRNDFIELLNISPAVISLTGWSVQYSSATGSSWQETVLSGLLAPGHYYLIQEAAGTGGTMALPTPDATGMIALSATAGKIALLDTTALLAGTNPLSNPDLEDFVGFGLTANAWEGSGPAPAPSNTTADLRLNNGLFNTNNNAADFVTGAPNPRNMASPPVAVPEPGPLTLAAGGILIIAMVTLKRKQHS